MDSVGKGRALKGKAGRIYGTEKPYCKTISQQTIINLKYQLL